MARNYSENLASNQNDPVMMRKRAAKFESVKGPQIIPVPSIWNIVPPGLHITLNVAPAFITYCEVTADLLDEEVDEAALVGVGDILDMGEESGEEEEAEAEDEKEAEDKEAPATATGSSKVYSEDRVKLELEVQEAKIKVQEADLEVQQLNKDALHRMNILRRIKMNHEAACFDQQGKDEEAKAKWTEVEAIGKAENSNKRFRKSFRFCGKLCLFTAHDHKIREELCTSCRLSCHSECELWDAMEAVVPAAAVDGEMDVEDADDEEGAKDQEDGRNEETIAEGGREDRRTCNDCRTSKFQGFGEMSEVVQPWLLEGQDKLMAAQVVLERARAKEQAKSEELKHVVGPRRKELIRLLEEELHVVKTAYQGGTFVGNHCTQILVNHEKLSAVLASTTRPEIQENFNKIASTYLRIHHLMKAARWLTAEEVIIAV